MKALLDTNIIIHRENTKVSNYGIGLLFYWLDKLNYEKCIHPYSEQELRKFKDNNMQSLYNAKLPAYTTLQTIARQSDDFRSKLPEEKSQNDKIDNQLLYEVYCNRVDILITEDKNLRKRSKLFSLRPRVLSINDFISKCTAENPNLISYKMLAVKKEYFGNVNVKDSFFDTFRVAYPEFDNWFAKKSNEEIYICRTDQSDILGFLYIKTENETENYLDIKPIFQPKRRLKIGTFKIETSGFRLGERFIKIIFDNALERNVDEIYVTLFEDRPELKALEDLLTVWGFSRYGIKQSNGKEEAVFVKKLKVYDTQLSVKQNYPNILLENRQKFILPIYAKYHTSLLPDSKLNTENEIDFLGKEPHRYALQKVYISWSPERDIHSGDLILFYRIAETEGRKKYESVLSTIGMVDSIKCNFKNKEEFLETCQNRSVFSKSELDSFWNYHSKSLLVLRFIFVKSLTKRLTLEYLWNCNIVSAPKGPRPFTRISDEQFTNILRDSQTKITFIGGKNV